MRILTVAVLVTLCLLASGLVVSGSAQAAKPSVKKSFRGQTMIDGKSAFPLYRELGVGIFQQSLSWPSIAPTRPANPRDPDDPAYEWPADLDFAAREANRHGIRLSLLVQRFPGWSNGGQPINTPSTDLRDYADFLEALSKRYPRVRHWMILGEPIRFSNFLIHFGYPTQRSDNGALDATQQADARRYAELLDTAYGRLKRLNRRNLVIGGNTTTEGDWFSPEQWIKNLKLADGRPPRMDLFGHNPFGSRKPDLRKKQIVPGTADFSDLDVLVRWLDRDLNRSGRNRRLKVYISEFTAPTDVKSYEFPYHVTRKVQAQWLTAGLRIARRWSRIYTFGWFTLQDRPPRGNGEESRTGIIDGQGRRKPAFNAYKRG